MPPKTISLNTYLVDPSERRHVHGLSSDSSSTANTGGVLAGAGVDDGVHHHLERVLSGQQVDDLEAVLDDPDSQQLLAVVPAVHHQAVDQALHDGALGLAEPLGGEPVDILLIKSSKNGVLNNNLTFQQSGAGTWQTSP